MGLAARFIEMHSITTYIYSFSCKFFSFRKKTINFLQSFHNNNRNCDDVFYFYNGNIYTIIVYI